MITKNSALLACISLLQDFLDTDDNDQAEAVDACIQQAKDAIALPAFEDYDITIMGPEGIEIHPEPYEDIQAAIRAAATFPLRFLRQGYFRSSRGEEIPLTELPNLISLQLDLPEPEDDDEATTA